MITTNQIDQLDSMYPAVNFMLAAGDRPLLGDHLKWSSVYGYSFGRNAITVRGRRHELSSGQYFSLFVGAPLPAIECSSKMFLVFRLGYKCQDSLGWVEPQGRLSYIDGCTDSLLIYPPRLGDPSLNLLYFPPGIEQTRHLHPSIRIGCVIEGSGISDVWENGEIVSRSLEAGTNFCLEENELHRFRTDDSSMVVVAWHPDGDWGPTDHNHTMLNRTYIKK